MRCQPSIFGKTAAGGGAASNFREPLNVANCVTALGCTGLYEASTNAFCFDTLTRQWRGQDLAGIHCFLPAAVESVNEVSPGTLFVNMPLIAGHGLLWSGYAALLGALVDNKPLLFHKVVEAGLTALVRFRLALKVELVLAQTAACSNKIRMLRCAAVDSWWSYCQKVVATAPCTTDAINNYKTSPRRREHYLQRGALCQSGRDRNCCRLVFS